MTSVYCLGEAQVAPQDQPGNGEGAHSPSSTSRTVSAHHLQGISQSWPPNALDSTVEGDKRLTAEAVT